MKILEKIKNKSVIVGIVGMGYVGLPLGLAFAAKNINVLGFDLDDKKVKFLTQGKSYIKHISEKKIKDAVKSGRLKATTDFSRLPEVDAIIICVPTPLDEHREPDMSYVVNTAKTIAKYLRKGQLVTLESTTYPGTTDEILKPLFENAAKAGKNKFKVGKDFYLAFSPEREDPNNQDFSTVTIPKVVGGVTPKCLEIAAKLYDLVIIKTVHVSSTKAAEASKLLENIYRSINIAMVNELKMVFDRMNIDIWEVIAAASTKPFGFKPFYPGPGLGGHCIPIDPFYLTWKAREFEINTKFIELAGEINTHQPYYVVERSVEALNKFKKALNGSKVLILGAAYKKDIDDMRESPSLKLIEIYREKGATVDYYDPLIPVLPKTRHYNYNMKSVKLSKENLKSYDLLVLSTDHSMLDYKFIAQNSKLIVDSRNAFESRGIKSKNIFKA
ncbi:MAG TPA: nucleotide sugar dehydrogenase [Ignavibacteriaceae bacterium]|nr:nucleotide sugar dehydrogenase [Ignavibacteriaceae bacterium]